MTWYDSRDVAADPATPFATLAGLAEQHPREVLGNPALPLLLLENPELGQEVEGRARAALAIEEMKPVLADLPVRGAAWWTAACVERAEARVRLPEIKAAALLVLDWVGDPARGDEVLSLWARWRRYPGNYPTQRETELRDAAIWMLDLARDHIQLAGRARRVDVEETAMNAARAASTSAAHASGHHGGAWWMALGREREDQLALLRLARERF